MKYFPETQCEPGADRLPQVLRGAFLRGIGAHRGRGDDGNLDLGRKTRFEAGVERECMASRVVERLVEEIGGLLETVVDSDPDRRTQRGDLLREIGRSAEVVTAFDVGLCRGAVRPFGPYSRTGAGRSLRGRACVAR